MTYCKHDGRHTIEQSNENISKDETSSTLLNYNLFNSVFVFFRSKFNRHPNSCCTHPTCPASHTKPEVPKNRACKFLRELFNPKEKDVTSNYLNFCHKFFSEKCNKRENCRRGHSHRHCTRKKVETDNHIENPLHKPMSCDKTVFIVHPRPIFTSESTIASYSTSSSCLTKPVPKAKKYVDTSTECNITKKSFSSTFSNAKVSQPKKITNDKFPHESLNIIVTAESIPIRRPNISKSIVSTYSDNRNRFVDSGNQTDKRQYEVNDSGFNTNNSSLEGSRKISDSKLVSESTSLHGTDRYYNNGPKPIFVDSENQTDKRQYEVNDSGVNTNPTNLNNCSPEGSRKSFDSNFSKLLSTEYQRKTKQSISESASKDSERTTRTDSLLERTDYTAGPRITSESFMDPSFAFDPLQPGKTFADDESPQKSLNIRIGAKSVSISGSTSSHSTVRYYSNEPKPIFVDSENQTDKRQYEISDFGVNTSPTDQIRFRLLEKSLDIDSGYGTKYSSGPIRKAVYPKKSSRFQSRREVISESTIKTSTSEDISSDISSADYGHSKKSPRLQSQREVISESTIETSTSEDISSDISSADYGHPKKSSRLQSQRKVISESTMETSTSEDISSDLGLQSLSSSLEDLSIIRSSITTETSISGETLESIESELLQKRGKISNSLDHASQVGYPMRTASYESSRRVLTSSDSTQSSSYEINQIIPIYLTRISSSSMYPNTSVSFERIGMAVESIESLGFHRYRSRYSSKSKYHKNSELYAYRASFNDSSLVKRRKTVESTESSKGSISEKQSKMCIYPYDQPSISSAFGISGNDYMNETAFHKCHCKICAHAAAKFKKQESESDGSRARSSLLNSFSWITTSHFATFLCTIIFYCFFKYFSISYI